MTLKIVLGSTSQGKMLAATNAMLALGFNHFSLHTHSVPSGVPAQPRDSQTRDGALNRARGARLKEDGAWGLGIENGLFFEGGEWRDAAVIVLTAPDGQFYEVRSESLAFPADLVAEAERRGFDRVTVGEVMAERYGGSSTDPHAFLTGGAKPRIKYLEEALIRLFTNVFPKGETAMEDVHEVSIGSLVLHLPIRQVAPTVKVALFNPLGDWRVNEAAGEELVSLMPEGVEILVMPDGKAQALLHVLGRKTRLPTVVARKEQKPYMGDCVSVEVKSITTQKVQHLFLSEADARLLRGRRVALVDDVVSTGATLTAMKQLLEQVGAIYVCTLAVFTEGPDERPDVLALGNLPLF